MNFFCFSNARGCYTLWRLISQKKWKIRTWNFDTIWNQVSNLCYQNLDSISSIVWKICAFPQRSNFISFFIITFDWNHCIFFIESFFSSMSWNVSKKCQKKSQSKNKFSPENCIYFFCYGREGPPSPPEAQVWRQKHNRRND